MRALALLAPVATLSLLAALSGCSADGRPLVTDGEDPSVATTYGTTPKDALNALAATPAERTNAPRDPSMICPAGATVDADTALCVDKNGNAIGPFPDGMRDACRAAGAGAVCETDAWPVALADTARNAGMTADPLNLDDSGLADCPAGTSVDFVSGICSDGTFVYAPFYPFEIAACRELGGGTSCDAGRFPRTFTRDPMPSVNGPDLASLDGLSTLKKTYKSDPVKPLSEKCGKAAELYNDYSENYGQVQREGAAWGAKNKTTALCATDAALAMRRIDPSFPLDNTHTVDGYNKSSNSYSGKPGGFREALEGKSWTPVSKSDCQPGDFAFTTEGNEYDKSVAKPKNPRVNSWDTRNKAHSAHVFMVTNRTGDAFSAMDNQMKGYQRGGGLEVAYCMRAPGVKQGCNDFDCTGKSDGNYCGKIGKISNVVTCEGGRRTKTLQCASTQTCAIGPAPSGDLVEVVKTTCK